MSGSAAVLMCAYAVGMLRPEGLSEVHFIAPACENVGFQANNTNAQTDPVFDADDFRKGSS